VQEVPKLQTREHLIITYIFPLRVLLYRCYSWELLAGMEHRVYTPYGVLQHTSPLLLWMAKPDMKSPLASQEKPPSISTSPLIKLFPTQEMPFSIRTPVHSNKQ